MKALVTVRDEFAASHSVRDHSTCWRGDGHTWLVEASVSGEISPKTGMVVDHGEFADALRTICNELRHRDLNDMLPGVVTTPEGIASYIRERLILTFPGVTRVSVSYETYSAVLEWPLR